MTRLRMAHPFPSCLFLHATDEMVSSAQPPNIVLTSWSMAMGIWSSRLLIIFFTNDINIDTII